MKLYINSVSAKLYRWVFATNQMPKNLCPYFWKLVLMWIILVPYVLLSLPYILIFNKRFSKGDSFGEKPAAGLVMWIVLYMVGVMIFSISVFWIEFSKGSFPQNMQIFGIMLWGIVIIVGICEGVKWAIRAYKRSKIKYDERGFRIQEEPKSDSILMAFIKAKYNKYCPKIEWSNEK